MNIKALPLILAAVLALAGGASAQDILDLLVEARNAVKEKFNIELIPEIEVLGDWDSPPDFLNPNADSKKVNL